MIRTTRTTRRLLLATAFAVAASGCASEPAALPRDADATQVAIPKSTRLVQLTRAAMFDDASDPAVTGDGAWVAFRATPAGVSLPQVYVAPLMRGEGGHVESGTPVRVTPAASRNAKPAFSPDGDRLLFASTADASRDPATLDDARPPFALRHDALAQVFRADGWRRAVAASDVRAGVDLARFPITDNPGFDGEPAWGPCGRFVAFASDRAAPRNALVTRPLVDIFVANADGTGAVRLTTQYGFDGRPAWSPCGGYIAFEAEREGRCDVWVVALDRGSDVPSLAASPRRLTKRPDARDPAWHPSGLWLVYSAADPRSPDGGRELRRVDADGGGDRPLRTWGVPGGESPAFDATGSLLVFSARSHDGTRQVFAAVVD